MGESIAYCGICCSACPVYLASQADNVDMKKKVLDTWSKQYNMQLSIEEISCSGCKSKGCRLFPHCERCKIRECAREKSLNYCSDCISYPCLNLEELFLQAPDAKSNLELLL